MRCPYCDADNDKVIDSRAADGGHGIRRRRECLACGRRFSTREAVEERVRLTVIKNDGSRVPWDRQKILTGLERACYKRPIAIESLQKIVEQVEDAVFRKFEREVQSIEIGKAVAERLKALDQVAYVRFASVYKQFRDLDDLLQEVREVLDSAPPPAPGQGLLF
ncbi:MAG: transcriptional repressor NrdR [Phycisphaeraceae bacterium]|nr:transcriptional repressor NrdR [Phycisphaeraceae bacterium]